MAITQSTYSENIEQGRPGQIADTATCTVQTYVSENVISFGVACQQGTSEDEAQSGVATNTFIGVTVKDPTLEEDGVSDNQYRAGSHASVLFRGTLWVECDGAVTAGSNVTAESTTGALGTIATSGTQILISGARFMTAGADGDLVKIRLSGHVPAI